MDFRFLLQNYNIFQNAKCMLVFSNENQEIHPFARMNINGLVVTPYDLHLGVHKHLSTNFSRKRINVFLEQ